jgi:preprotein translocase subunit YajC
MFGSFSGAVATFVLAQAAAPADGAAAKAPAANPPAGGIFESLGLAPVLVAITVLFYFMLIRPQKREQAARQSMLDQLKKNDRVVTSGGFYGIVVNVHQSADEVTLKVDEASNTRLKVTRSSIVRVLGDEPVETSESKDNK